MVRVNTIKHTAGGRSCNTFRAPAWHADTHTSFYFGVEYEWPLNDSIFLSATCGSVCTSSAFAVLHRSWVVATLTIRAQTGERGGSADNLKGMATVS